MALQGQTVDVQLLPPDQQAPATGAPPGRIKRLVNGVASKYEREGRQALRVEKRFGFRRLDDDIRNPASGADLTDTFGEPDLLTTFRDQLISVDTDAVPNVRASTAERWERFVGETVLPRSLSQEVVFAGPAQASLPDGATIGGVHCYTWRQGSDIYATIVDEDNTPIRTRFIVSAGVRAKVVSDGTRFWIFVVTAAYSINAHVYDGETGVALNAAVVETGAGAVFGGNDWDVTYQSGLGVLWIGRDATATTQLHILSISGTTITNTEVLVSSVGCNQGVAWLLNDSGDSDAYCVAASLEETAEVFRVFRLNASGIVSSAELVNADVPTPGYINASGYVVSTGGNGRQAVVFATEMPDEDFQLDNITRVMVQTLGSLSAATEVQEVRKVGVASRAFRIASNYYCVAYYSSVYSFDASFGSQLGQPTFFLLRMSTSGSRMVGVFDHGRAAMGWPENGTALGLAAAGRWHLGSPFVDSTNAFTHLPLGFNSSQQVVDLEDQGLIIPIASFASSVGVKDTVIGAVGQAVEYANELLLPGPLPISFTGGAFSEQGVCLAPEAPTVTSTNDASGQLVVGRTYDYVIVFEWTQPNGDRARSVVSVPRNVTISSGHEAATLVGDSLTMTSRDDVVVSVYRNYFDPVSSTMTTIHRKVSNDLDPLFNDPGDDTWTFVDLMSDAECALQEVLYTDLGQLQHDQAPAFRCGTVVDNRVILGGYDGYLWVSAEKTPEEALWWNRDALRIAMPTSDPFVAITVLDARILIWCQSSIWWIPRGVFPDATGAGGALRAPERLPFENGSANGHVTSVRGGIVYDHSKGGAWILTRDLNNVDLGAPAFDDLNGSTITGIAADQNGRVHIGISLAGPEADPGLLVFDTLAGTWYKWEWAGQVGKVTTWRGEVVASTTSTIWLYTPGQYVDGVDGDDEESEPIITALVVDYVHLFRVKDFKRIWAVQLTGEYKGDHDLRVDVCFDDDPERTAVTTYEFTPDADEPYHFELPPKEELCSSMGFTITDSFPRTMGNASFAIELLSFYVALEKGLARIPPTVRRIIPNPGIPAPGGGSTVVGQTGVNVVVAGVNTGATQLSTYNAASLRSGSFAYVLSLRAHYWLDRDTDGAADGLFRVAAKDGSGTTIGWWTRIIVADPYWHALYEDSGEGAFLDRSDVSGVADDENPGDDDSAPLVSGRELMARLHGANGTFRVRVMSNSTTAEDGDVYGFTGMIYFEGLTTQVASGTLTGSSPRTTGNGKPTITDSGRANWSGFISSTGGTRWIRAGAVLIRCAMLADAGGGAAVIFQPIQQAETGPVPFTAATAFNFGSTDAYQIYAQPKFPMINNRDKGCYVQTICLDHPGGSVNAGGGWTPALCGFLGDVYIEADSFLGVARGCLFLGDVYADGSFTLDYCVLKGAYTTTRQQTWTIAAAGSLINGSFPPAGEIAFYVSEGSGVSMGILYVWDATVAALKAERGSTVHLNALRGQGNTNFLVEAERSVVYGSGGISATTSATDKYRLNGADSATAPGQDTTNGGAIFA